MKILLLVSMKFVNHMKEDGKMLRSRRKIITFMHIKFIKQSQLYTWFQQNIIKIFKLMLLKYSQKNLSGGGTLNMSKEEASQYHWL